MLFPPCPLLACYPFIIIYWNMLYANDSCFTANVWRQFSRKITGVNNQITTCGVQIEFSGLSGQLICWNASAGAQISHWTISWMSFPLFSFLLYLSALMSCHKNNKGQNTSIKNNNGSLFHLTNTLTTRPNQQDLKTNITGIQPLLSPDVLFLLLYWRHIRKTWKAI